MLYFTVGDGFFITINNQPYEEFSAGQDVTVTCEFVGEGGKAAQPAWRDPDGVIIKPSGTVSSDRHISTREVSPLVTELTIRNIQPMDSGVYTCHVGSSTNTLTVDLQECIYPCQNGGSCVDGSCNCLDGFTGQYCDTPVVECVVPCENNGQCVDGVCMCADGFDGNLCEISVGDGIVINIIKDSLGPHQSGQDVVVTCDYSSTVRYQQPAWIDPQGTSVQPNSQGRLRSIAVSPSSTQLSISNIQPTDSGVYTCYVGTRSNTFTLTIHDIEFSCQRNCVNGGVCYQGICECPPSFAGASCEFQLSGCDFPCANGGICIEGLCACVSGYEGDFCQTYGRYY